MPYAKCHTGLWEGLPFSVSPSSNAKEEFLRRRLVITFLEAACIEIEKLSDTLAAMPVIRKAVKGDGKRVKHLEPGDLALNLSSALTG